ncbi:MAG: type 2 isopentenyl-diphosphate Delta-isomerase [Bacteroidales bacterium]|nr:type 2 isopentenyl-diphosphate Delta-isomerase [Bacteroidales bacterium]
METLENRKKDHIDLAFKSQAGLPELDNRFHYEPVLREHPRNGLQPFTFLGKTHRAPLWISSMTGGTKLAGIINRNLAMACNEFGMGMGLGSCRIIMEDKTYFDDFNMRRIIGGDLPFYANLGIAQIEELLERNQVSKAVDLVRELEADGLVVHINPIQEWFQPEGDIFTHPPVETLRRFLDRFSFPVIVKEVGQGMGPESLRSLLQLPLQAIEFGGFGGTNFARVELLRDDRAKKEHFEPLSLIGEDPASMVGYVNRIIQEEKPMCRELIVSGGIKTFLDGYYLIRKSQLPAIYGMASTFLKYARGDYEQLRNFVMNQVQGLEMAYAYLTIKE